MLKKEGLMLLVTFGAIMDSFSSLVVLSSLLPRRRSRLSFRRFAHDFMRAGNHSFEILILYASLYLADGDNKKPRTGNAEHLHIPLHHQQQMHSHMHLFFFGGMQASSFENRNEK